uniref:Uncharacterized protein n=1 Tax=Opuntia streptacantha TaxID=393608 RepID=A0A7C8ZG41_OPUST
MVTSTVSWYVLYPKLVLYSKRSCSDSNSLVPAIIKFHFRIYPALSSPPNSFMARSNICSNGHIEFSLRQAIDPLNLLDLRTRTCNFGKLFNSQGNPSLN